MLSDKNLTEKKLNRMLLLKKSGTLGLTDTSYLILMHDYWHSEVYWPHGGFSSVPHTSCLVSSTLPMHRNLGPHPAYHPSYSSPAVCCSHSSSFSLNLCFLFPSQAFLFCYVICFFCLCWSIFSFVYIFNGYYWSRMCSYIHYLTRDPVSYITCTLKAK